MNLDIPAIRSDKPSQSPTDKQEKAGTRKSAKPAEKPSAAPPADKSTSDLIEELVRQTLVDVKNNTDTKMKLDVLAMASKWEMVKAKTEASKKWGEGLNAAVEDDDDVNSILNDGKEEDDD